MNIIKLLLTNALAVALSTSVHSQLKSLSKADIVMFKYHFEVLDSLSDISKTDTIFCRSSVTYMMKNTGIDSSMDGTYLGTFYCTRQDIIRWHSWFMKMLLQKGLD